MTQAHERVALAALDSQQLELTQLLHDTLSQNLSAARLYARVNRGALERACPEAVASAVTLEQVVSTAAEELQDLIRWLRPIRLGDGDAVDRLAELAQLASRALPCEFRGRTEIGAALEVQTELVRIAQLALHGLVLRSGAHRLELRLDMDAQDLIMELRASGASAMPNDFVERLDQRARSLGGSFAAEPAADGCSAWTCRLPRGSR